MSDQDIVIYTGSGVELSLPMDRERETVLASQAQIEDLFGVDQSGVSRHIRNILRDAEVDRESNMQKVHIAPADRPVTLYSLDAFTAREDVDHFAKVLPHGVIAERDYLISVPSYVEAEDTHVATDITALNAEIARIFARQSKLRTAIDAIVADLEGVGA